MNSQNKKLRCAIYTRTSEKQDNNSKNWQRESAERYVQEKEPDRWTVLPEFYDDSGFSGGTMDRPGLQRLLDDVNAGKIDVVVIFRLDRLSRDVSGFQKIVETFTERDVCIAVVTESFNFNDPIGHMFLKIITSAAQAEKELEDVQEEEDDA